MLNRRVFLFISFTLIIIGGIITYGLLMNFFNYSPLETLRSETAAKTNYEVAFGGIVAYNPDGVSLLDNNGTQKWNVSFEMQTPRIEKNEKFAVVYDRQGSIVEIINADGEAGRINTSYPVTAASLSKNGHVSVIMQQQEVAKIVTYDASGNILAQGELYGGESGYPLALSLSSDGNVLAVSVLHLSEADVKTQIIIYDFSDAGKSKENNISSVFSFPDVIIPVLDHVNGDKILAIGTKGAMIFSSGTEPKVSEEVFFDKEVKSTMHNNSYFGIITEEETGENANENSVTNLLTVYSINGQKKFEKKINATYSKCKLMDNNEIFITDGKQTSIYTKYGIEKFSYIFEADIQDIIPAKGLRSYYLLQNGELSRIRLD